MHILTRSGLAVALSISPTWTACAGAQATQWTDWGGGYSRGPDSALTTIATSGAGASKPAPAVAPSVATNVPITDWGGGYLRGPDSASTTVATSGAGAPNADQLIPIVSDAGKPKELLQ